MNVVFSFLICFIFLYILLFFITLFSTHLIKMYFEYKKNMIHKEEELKIRPQQKVKKKEVKKKWNESLGIWEVEQ